MCIMYIIQTMLYRLALHVLYRYILYPLMMALIM